MKKLYIVKVRVENCDPVTMGVYTSREHAMAFAKCYRYTIADCETWVEEKTS